MIYYFSAFFLLSMISCPLAFAAEETIHQHTKEEAWETWSADDLIEFASLLREQAYYVCLFDVILNNKSLEFCTPRLRHRATKIRAASPQILKSEKEGEANLGTESDEVKTVALQIFYCLYHLAYRFKDPRVHEHLVAMLDKFQNEELKNLREFTKIVQQYKKELSDAEHVFRNFASPDQFIHAFKELEPVVRKIINEHHLKLRALEEINNQVIQTLIIIKHADLSKLKDLYSHEPFCIQIKPIEPQENHRLKAETSPENYESCFVPGHPPFDRGAFKDWSTPCLHQALSLLEEQAYWISLIHAILCNAPDKDLDGLIQSDRTTIRTKAEEIMKFDDIISIKEISDDQKRRAIELYLSIMSVADDKLISTKRLLNILGQYPDSSLLEPLRQLVTLSRREDSTYKSFIINYDAWRNRICAVLGSYCDKMQAIKENAADIREHLLRRIIDQHIYVIDNIFTSDPLFLFTFTEDTDGIPQLECTNGPSFIGTTTKSECKIIRPSVNTPESRADVNKMTPDHLYELASLLREQSNCIDLFATALRTTKEKKQLDKELDAIHTHIIYDSAEAIKKRQAVDPEYAKREDPLDSCHGLVLYNTFCHCFAQKETSAKEFAEAIAHNPFPELRPLKKLFCYFDLLTKLFGTMSPGLDMTYQADDTKKQTSELITALKTIITNHDSMLNKIKTLYSDVLNRLKSRKSTRRSLATMRSSAFSGRHMPAEYSTRKPSLKDAHSDPAPQGITSMKPLETPVKQGSAKSKAYDRKVIAPALQPVQQNVAAETSEEYVPETHKVLEWIEKQLTKNEAHQTHQDFSRSTSQQPLQEDALAKSAAASCLRIQPVTPMAAVYELANIHDTQALFDSVRNHPQTSNNGK